MIRDDACDLGIEDRPIAGRVIIHHLNPITKEDIAFKNPLVFSMNNLICVSHNTHVAIHYSNEEILAQSKPLVRAPNDTCLWKD